MKLINPNIITIEMIYDKWDEVWIKNKTKEQQDKYRKIINKFDDKKVISDDIDYVKRLSKQERIQFYMELLTI